jgi:sugar phosphate isomerase/epimerase
MRSLSAGAAGVFTAGTLTSCASLRVFSKAKPGSKMRFGLVTYLWGKFWDLPTLIRNCEETRVLGVELRTEHAHGVESSLNGQQRRDVRKRFADSPVMLVGLGTNFAFHHVDPAKVQEDMNGTRDYIKLSHDVGGSGVKVKPNALPKGVPIEKTIDQISSSLNELGRFAANYGQEIRVEVHGTRTRELPTMERIFDIVDEPNVGVCWNSNLEDLHGRGLENNFSFIKDRFGATAHVRELDIGPYPYQQLINLFVQMDYTGWILLEARTKPEDRVKALAEQRMVFEQMVANAQALG